MSHLRSVRPALTLAILAAAAVALAVTLGANSAQATPAKPARAMGASGWVVCIPASNVDPRRYVVGIWVDVYGVRKGWASWRSDGGSGAYWSYPVPSGRFYKLTVGCGGTRLHWATSVRTGYMSFSPSYSYCYVRLGYCESVR